MAPSPDTEDYYSVLEVEQNATPEQVARSYKRLALILHPDRNVNHDTTKAFQLLGQAYETLKDKSKRQTYDHIYPSIKQNRRSPQSTRTHFPSSTSTSQSGGISDAAQILSLQKSKQERSAQLATKKNIVDSLIFELQRDIRRLEQEIRNLDSIVAAEAAKEAEKNSWVAWLLSPISQRVEDSEEDKIHKDRKRQERKIEKEMKERRLGLKKANLQKEESIFRKAKVEIDAANLVDDGKIRVIQARIWARDTRERQEKERVERERVVRIWKEEQEQRKKKEREMAEAAMKLQAEQRAAAQRLHEEQARNRQRFFDHNEQYLYTTERGTYQASKIICIHDGWWSKVQGRTACPECHEVWTYLLQCPACKMKACPKCQSTIRPRGNRRTTPRRRTSSEDDFSFY